MGMSPKIGLRLELRQNLPLCAGMLLPPQDAELLLEECLDSLDEYTIQEPDAQRRGNFINTQAFGEAVKRTQKRASRASHQTEPAMIAETEGGIYVVQANPSIDARVNELLSRFRTPEGVEPTTLANRFTKVFRAQYEWAKGMRKDITTHLLTQQAPYLASKNLFDLEEIAQKDVGQEFDLTESTISRLVKGLTVRLPTREVISAQELMPGNKIHALRGIYAISELMKESDVYSNGKWQISCDQLQQRLQTEYGMDVQRRAVNKYRKKIDDYLRNDLVRKASPIIVDRS